MNMRFMEGQSNMVDLAGLPILDGLSEAEWREIQSYLETNEYEDGAVVLQQGQVSGRFHIIVSGTLDVCLEQEVEVSVAKLGRGRFVGEMSCLTSEAVSATVRAEGPMRTVSMAREGLLLLMEISASFRKHMLEAMVQRIQASNKRVADEHTRSYIVTQQLAHAQESRLGQFVGSSSMTLRLQEDLVRLSQTIDPVWIVGEDGVGKFHAAFEIHSKSGRTAHPFLTLEGLDFRIEDWRMQVRAADGGTIVIRQADALSYDIIGELLSSSGEARLIMTGGSPQSHRGFQQLEISPLRERSEDIADLVFEFLRREGALIPDEAISPEALRMLAAYPYLRGNVEELGRIVTNAYALSGGRMIWSTHLRFGSVRKPGERPRIGLALGSGSVRGAAHVGVMKVLEEEGISIDYIAGTSVGAFIGALYAGGQSIEAFERVLPNVRWRQLVSVVLPPKAFVDNHPMVKFVERYIGPVEFSELSIPFAAVASDALSGEAYILNKGRVSRAICATTAIPGVMRPVQHDERLLIDGAVVHPVPVALCKSMGADIVIAVDVSVPATMRRSPKNIISSILNTIDIMSDKIMQEEMQLADIVLKPQLDIQEYTFKSSGLFIERGVHVTRQSIAAIRQAVQEVNL